MTTPTLKIAALTIGIGGATIGSGIAIKNYLSTSNEVAQKENAPKDETPQTESIVNLLKGENMTLILESEDKNTVWKPKWDQFKTDHKSVAPDEIWKIDGWSNSPNDEGDLEKFKAICKTNGAKNSEGKTTDLYTKVKKYCAKQIDPATKHE